MKKLPKLLSIILAGCLMITIFPLPAMAVSDKPVSFTDTKGHWAEKYINYWANTPAKDGSQYVIKGYSDGTFMPDANITRGAAAAILDRANGYKTTGKVAGFNDVKSDNVFYKNIIACADNGIIYGYADGSFRPTNNITRQSAIAIIARCTMKAADYQKFSNQNECYKILSEKFRDADSISTAFYPEICFMCSNGGLDGYSDGTLKPVQNVTRAQFAKLLYSIVNSGESPNDPSVKPETYSLQLSLTDDEGIFVNTVKGVKSGDNFVSMIMEIVKNNKFELNNKFKTGNVSERINTLIAIYNTNTSFGWNSQTREEWNNYVHQCFKGAYGDLPVIETFANVDSTLANVGCGTYIVITPDLKIALIVKAE